MVQTSINPNVSDLVRILNIPIVGEATEGLVEGVSREYLTRKAYEDEEWRFLTKQAEALMTFIVEGSCFCPIGVGHGKTGASLAIAGVAPVIYPDVKRSMLFIPPKLVTQLLQVDLPNWVPKLVHKPHQVRYAGRPLKERMRTAQSAPLGMYVTPYSLLSQKEYETELTLIDPDLLIFDECHNIKDFDRPKCSRIARFMANRAAEGRPVRVVAMSGTIVHKQLMDFAHFLIWICGNQAPIPKMAGLMKVWNSYISSETTDSGMWATDNGVSAEEQEQSIFPLINWANERVLSSDKQLPLDRQSAWHAFRLRLVLSPHVVSTTDDDIGVSLNFDRFETTVRIPREVQEYWNEVQSGIDIIPMSERKPDPDGTPFIPMQLPTPMQRHAIFTQLSAGFFYWYKFPDNLSQEDVDLTRQWLEARRNERRAMSAFLSNTNIPGLDSPFLVGSSMKNHGAKQTGDHFLYHHWLEWKRIDGEMARRGIEPERHIEWLSDDKVESVMLWISKVQREEKRHGGIIFVQSRALGERLFARIQRDLGVDSVLRALGGDKTTSEIINPKNRNKYIVGSFGSIADGLNLQYHQRMLMAQIPPSARALQQAVGRIHRTGQKADEVTVDWLMNTEFEEQELWLKLQDTAFAGSATPQSYKALQAKFLFSLDDAPMSFLRSMGFEQSRLPDEERHSLRSRFGWASSENRNPA